ncbi:hypothetical protein O181_070154 [Austropuccinia psidii MF-1]|uniref:Uncharacterized protein n=1 Tax=Austropuccinia psidii MF-1 TaxID=1389203 RepID=A0A9Q3I976_9BASI|nr:hypothetical protein [Austropuccinia psidii MF-1]
MCLQLNQEPAITPQEASKKVIDLTSPQEASVDIYKASQKSHNNALKHKEYQILADQWKNSINSYLTVRIFLGHPNTCKLLNRRHAVLEKKNMIPLTAERRKKNPPPPKQVPKTAPVSRSNNSNLKNQPKPQQWQRQGTSHKTVQPGLHNPRNSEGCHGKFITDGQNNDGITEKGGCQIKISEMIFDTFDAI